MFLYRLALAAIHHNENGNRLQAVDKEGNGKYSVVFPKAKKGEASVRTRKTPPTYSKY